MNSNKDILLLLMNMKDCKELLSVRQNMIMV